MGKEIKMKNAWIKNEIGPTGPKNVEFGKIIWKDYGITGATGEEDIPLQYYLDQIKKLKDDNFILEEKLKSAQEVIHKNQLLKGNKMLNVDKKPLSDEELEKSPWMLNLLRDDLFMDDKIPTDIKINYDNIPNSITIDTNSTINGMDEVTKKLDKINARLDSLEAKQKVDHYWKEEWPIHD
jgi:hypothetical protein